MKVLNLIWGFTLGAGIDKCYLTYARLGEIDSEIEMKNVCINLLNKKSHNKPLREIGVEFIDINSSMDFSWINKLYSCIQRENPDILFAHGFNGAIMTMLERYLKGIKIKTILTYHGAYHAPTRAKKMIEPFYNGLSIWIYKHLAHKTICVAQASNEFLQKKGVPKDKVTTVHNGIVEIEKPRPISLEGTGVKVLTASRIDTVKGLSFLLDALRILKDKGLLFTYYMVGEGPLLEELKGKTQALNLCDEVHFEGFQSNIPQWLESVDVFALPSIYEYHSIAVLEAMRAGVAIVATDVGGNCESVVDGKEALIVPPANAEALADALEKVMTDALLRKQLAHNAKIRFGEEFTETIMMRNLLKELKS